MCRRFLSGNRETSTLAARELSGPHREGDEPKPKQVGRQVAAGDDQPRTARQLLEQVAIEPRKLGIEDAPRALVEVAFEIVQHQHQEPAAVQPRHDRPQPVRHCQRRITQRRVEVPLPRIQERLAADLKQLPRTSGVSLLLDSATGVQPSAFSLSASRVASVLLPAPPSPVSTTACSSPARSPGSSRCNSRRRPMKCDV